MAKEYLEGTEPYLPGLTVTFLGVDENEAGRLVRRATEIPLQVECMAYDEEGNLSDAEVYIPYEDARDPATRIRLIQAMEAMARADDVTITELLSQEE